MLTTYRHFCASARVLEVYQPTELDCDYALHSAESLSSALHNAVKLSLRTEHVDVPDHQHQNRRTQAFPEDASLAAMLSSSCSTDLAPMITEETNGLCNT